MDDATRTRIDELIETNPVMLFMKGERGAPQCGFSATVCQILDSMVPEYHTVDVLSNPDIRDGIKEYSSWPTIPQLYIKGEFIGGCDIIREQFASGELHAVLGVEAQEVTPPKIHLSEAAAEALRQLSGERSDGATLHLAVDASFQSQMYFGPEEPGEVTVETSGITIAVEPMSAGRADGISVDCVESGEGLAFSVNNPNAPTSVEAMTVGELKELLDSGEPVLLLDVRSPEERALAHIPGSRLLDETATQELEGMDRNTSLVFHCHHGGRSQAAAQHFSGLGFRRVYNVVGGIDAWSTEVDPDVPRY